MSTIVFTTPLQFTRGIVHQEDSGFLFSCPGIAPPTTDSVSVTLLNTFGAND